MTDEEVLTPQQWYQIEKKRAESQGKCVLRRYGDPAPKLKGEVTEAQLAEAKKVFDIATQKKTHQAKHKQ